VHLKNCAERREARNIFGGIVRCDLIAEGILQAIEKVGLSLPIVVRLEGTNAQF
jgi:succinyl-CoA synthetase beta subunit